MDSEPLSSIAFDADVGAIATRAPALIEDRDTEDSLTTKERLMVVRNWA